MKDSLKKFLVMGATTLSLASPAMAGVAGVDQVLLPDDAIESIEEAEAARKFQEKQIEAQQNLQKIKNTQLQERKELQQKISSRLDKMLQEKREAKILTQQPDVKVNIIESSQTLRENNEISKEAGLYSASENNLRAQFTFDGNSANIKNDACHINVTYDDKGNMVPLEEASDNLFQSIQFENQQQREMAQEFILLHESYHCEFAKVDNPIRISGKSEDFNQKLNYALKDQITAIPAQKVSYIDTLNETFADVGASLMMQMKYGKDEATKKDFMFVMDVVKTERHSSYFQQTYDPHMTHFALDHVFDQENIERLEKISQNIKTQPDLINAKELRDLSFDIANKGTLELAANNEKMREAMLSPDALTAGVIANTAAMVVQKDGPEDLKKDLVFHSGFASNVSSGLSYDLGKEIAKEIDGSEYFTKDGKATNKLGNMQSDISNVVNSEKMSTQMKEQFKQSKEDIKELVNYAVNTYTPSNFDMVKINESLNKDVVSSKIAAMRASFAKRNPSAMILPIPAFK